MNDYLNIGSVPYDEDCAQVGSEDYETRSRLECVAFREQCKRVLADKFDDVCIIVSIKSFPHDFGTYREVVAIYDPDNQQEVEQALYLESAEELENWDKEAKEFLKANK